MPETPASRSKRLTKRNPQWFWVSNDWTIVCFLTHRRDDNFLTGKPNSELPEGTAASVPFCLVHKDHRNFLPCPELFLPERWLSQEKRERLEPNFFNDRVPYILNQSAFLAFSYGPANCVGRQLAYVEMRMAICLLLDRFMLKFAPGYNPSRYEDEFRDYYIVVKGSLPVLLTLRQ